MTEHSDTHSSWGAMTVAETRDDIEIRDYLPSDDLEAKTLDKASAQGSSFRLSFERNSFQRRAEGFDRHFIVTARQRTRLVGLGAVAVKDVTVLGEPMTGAFYFDFRTDSAFRGRGIGFRLGRALVERVGEVGMSYSYVAGDNPTGAGLAERSFLRPAGEYAYLILPTPGHRRRRMQPSCVDLREVHAALLASTPPFDFYTDPTRGGRLDGHAGSWLLRRGRALAGCSAWDNRGILGEVVERLPAPLRYAARLTRLLRLERAPLPRIPLPGEAIRSWYLFDTFATDGHALRDLLSHVTNDARERGIDYCYVIHSPPDEPIASLRGVSFAPISLTIPYRMLAWWRRGEFPRLQRIYVDVRDV